MKAEIIEKTQEYWKIQLEDAPDDIRQVWEEINNELDLPLGELDDSVSEDQVIFFYPDTEE